MNLQRKIEIVSDAIASIEHHNDEDAAVVKGALTAIIELASLAQARIDKRVAAEVASLTQSVISAA